MSTIKIFDLLDDMMYNVIFHNMHSKEILTLQQDTHLKSLFDFSFFFA